MKVSCTKNVLQNKLNHYLQIPDSYNLTQKKPNFTVHKKSRLHTAPSQPQQDTKHFFSSSFYDSFQFVDRLTRNKLTYKDARKSSTLESLKQSRIEERAQMSNLMQIYKKTKLFQMKSLRKRIFRQLNKKSDVGTIKAQKESQQAYKHGRNNSIKWKNTSISSVDIHRQPQKPSGIMEQSRKKNKFRSFIDKTIMDMNKAELHRVSTQGSFTSVKQQVLQFNQKHNIIKSDMNRNKIDELICLRKRQEFEREINPEFREKGKHIGLKDMKNLRNGRDSQQNRQMRHQTQLKVKQQDRSKKYQQPQIFQRSQKKKKKTFVPRFEDIFMQKMMTHAKNSLKKEGQYLIKPPQQIIRQKMLIKTGKNNKLLFSHKNYRQSIIKTEGDIDLKQFQFQQKDDSDLIKEMKLLAQEKSNGCEVMKETQNKVSLNENIARPYEMKNDLIFLLKNNLISSIGFQLLHSTSQCLSKDQKGNNLLHLAVRYDHPQVIKMIFNKAPFRTCVLLLNQKNHNNRTPYELAKLLVDRSALEIIEKYNHSNRQKYIMEDWRKYPQTKDDDKQKQN